MRKIVCRKSGFPIVCRYCYQRAGRPNGVRPALAKGQMQQVRCSACKKQWSVPVGRVEWLFERKRIHVPVDRLLQAFALVVVSVPLCRAAPLVRISAKIIRKWLLAILDVGCWERLDLVLADRFRIPGAYRSDFHDVIVLGRENGHADFLDWSKELRRLDSAGRQECARLASRILGRRVGLRTITGWSPSRRRRSRRQG